MKMMKKKSNYAMVESSRCARESSIRSREEAEEKEEEEEEEDNDDKGQGGG